jgi:hypothetical protein
MADVDLVIYAAGRAEKAADFMIGASAPDPANATGTDAAEGVAA